MRKFLKITGWIIGSIIFLVLCVVFWLQTGSGKNFVRNKALSFLRNKLKTEVYIGKINYAIPKMLELDDVLFKDEAKDTLLAAHKLRVDMNMFKLITGKVVIQQLELDGISAHIYRNTPDTNFNYNFIIKAFAGKDKPTAEDVKKTNDTSSSLAFDVDKIKFSNFHIRFDDYTGGSRIALDLVRLNLSLKKLDPSRLDFSIKKLAVAGLRTSFLQDTSYLAAKPKDTSQSKFHLAADEIQLDKIAFIYNDNLSHSSFNIHLGHFYTKPKNIDFIGQNIDIDALQLDTTEIIIATSAPAVAERTTKVADTIAQHGWHVNVHDIKLNAVNFRMDNNAVQALKYGMDYAHLDTKNIALQLNDLLYSRDTISGSLKHFAAQEKSGLDLKEFKTDFLYSTHGALLKNLLLQTDKTILQRYAEVKYPSLNTLRKNMAALQLNINLQNSQVGIKDILLFSPDLRKQEFFAKNQNAVLKLDAVLDGSLNAININKFALSGFGNTSIALSGKLNGLPDTNKINYDLHIQTFKSSRNDVASLLPAKTAEQIRLPDVFGISGHVAGTLKDYHTQLVMMTSDGDAYLKADILMSAGKNQEQYNIYLKTDRLNLGHILKQDTLLGRVTADFEINGRSFDVKNMNAVVNGNIQSAFIREYDYNQLSLHGKIENQRGIFKMISEDENLRLQLNANAGFENKYPSLVADLNIDSMNLQALKFYEGEFKIRTTIHADFPSLNADYPDGRLVFYSPAILNNGQRYFLDSMYISSQPTNDSSQNIFINTDVLYANITGHIPLTKIGGYMQEHITRHYSIADSMLSKSGVAKKHARKRADTTQENLPGKEYDMKLIAKIADRPLLHVFAPELKYIDSIHIEANMNRRDLNAKLSAPNIIYGSNTITGTEIKLTSGDSALNYNVVIKKLEQPKIQLLNTTVSGNIEPGKITFNLKTQDTAKKDRFALGAELHQQGQDNIISLREGLMINYKSWSVSPSNKIVLNTKGFYAQDFVINSGGESISIQSEAQQYNAPLTVKINNFILGDITQIISKNDTLLANGLLNGTINIKQIKPEMLLAADLQIQNLSVLNDTIGNLTAKAENKDANTIHADIVFSGNENDVQLHGDYFSKEIAGNNFDFTLAMNALNLKRFEGLAMNSIHNSSGFLRGNLSIKGTAQKPLIKGEIRTDNVATTITTLNARYRMPAEKIAFTADGINFNHFKILDSTDNKIVFKGGIKTKDFSNPVFNMNIRANKFNAVSSSQNQNKLFYGNVIITTNLNVNGTISAPDIDGSINILKGTKFTVAIPEKNITAEDSKGIVEFVDMSDTNRFKVLQPAKTDTMPKLALGLGSDINVNIAVEPEAEFTVLIDAASGDFLRVRGEAALNASVTPGGELALTGNYELKDGEYQLNYNLLKRNFKIQSGSNIIFAGDPLEATMNITAVYTANIPPYDLVQKEIADPSQLNYYKQRLPFKVDLILKGELLKPNISFNVELPEGQSYRLSGEGVDLVQAKLSQVRMDTSELNKQVFAVLILNHFIGEDPFSSGVNTSAESVARQSVARFISEQLNQYASSLIKGLDLSFDLASTDDYTTGERRDRTDLSIAASKRLLNDRLTITVGNNFELEGPQNSNTDNTSYIPGNLAADYLLTSDGRYTVRVYRKTQDEGVLEGFVTETGVNFIVTLDYNKFKNLFNKKARQALRKERRKQRKEEEQEEKETMNTGIEEVETKISGTN